MAQILQFRRSSKEQDAQPGSVNYSGIGDDRLADVAMGGSSYRTHIHTETVDPSVARKVDAALRRLTGPERHRVMADPHSDDAIDSIRQLMRAVTQHRLELIKGGKA